MCNIKVVSAWYGTLWYGWLLEAFPLCFLPLYLFYLFIFWIFLNTSSGEVIRELYHYQNVMYTLRWLVREVRLPVSYSAYSAWYTKPTVVSLHNQTIFIPLQQKDNWNRSIVFSRKGSEVLVGILGSVLASWMGQPGMKN